ncbi:type IV secretory system conjugative DNA transfer family protein [Agrobacterium sp. Ap1]|nr:type IV secretory system conjugative DNA transfer family protein [Agrobacterium sp. Ap1]
MADPTGYSPVARHLCQERRHPVECRRITGIRDQRCRDGRAHRQGNRQEADAVCSIKSRNEGKTSPARHISARDLINPDEIMRLVADRMILLRYGQRLVRAKKLRYFEDVEFRGMFG